jgi:hypothetical protein
MLYHVTRNGQNYGPYTLEDLQRYVASGNVLLTDLCKSDDMAQWLPVSQVLGIATPAAHPAYPHPHPPAYPPSGLAPYPDAPNLSWGLVLLFSFFTCTLFMWVWNLVLAAWMRRVRPGSNAVFYYIAATVLLCCQGVVGTHSHVVFNQPGVHWWVTYYTGHPLRNFTGLAVWIVRLIARFTMRSDLEQHFNGPEPVGLSLSGVMTFFFGGIYFQYKLNEINRTKEILRYQNTPR